MVIVNSVKVTSGGYLILKHERTIEISDGQKSIFITPYEVDDIITALRTVGKELK